MKTKRCFACKRELSVEMFWRDKSRPDGIEYRCKECRKSHRTYREQRRQSTARYIANYPERQRARYLARNVPLAAQCENCGSKGRLHKHHYDYSKPLEIVSLCVPCHEEAHHGVRI